MTKLFCILVFISTCITANSQSPNVDSLWKVVDSKSSVSEVNSAYNSIVNHYFKINLDTVLILSEEHLTYNRDHNFSHGQIDAYSNISQYFWMSANLTKADSCMQEALKIALEENDLKNQANCYNNLAAINWSRGNNLKTIEYLHKTIDIDASTGNTKGIGETYLNIGNVYALQENQEKALSYFHKAEKTIENPTADTQGLIYVNLASAYKELKSLDKAEDYSRKCIALFSEEENPRILGTAHNNLGKIHQERGDLDSAMNSFSKGLDYREAAGDIKGMSSSYTNIGEIHLLRSAFMDAESSCMKGYEISDSLGIEKEMMVSCLCLSKALQNLNRHDEAIQYLKRHVDLKDSLSGISKSKMIQNFDEEFQSQRKDLEIENLQASTKQANELNLKEKSLRQEEEKTNRFLMILVIFFILLAVAMISLFLYVRKSKQIIQEKNKLIGRTLKEKDVLMKEIHHRVKNNLQTVSSLLRLQSRYIDDENALSAVGEAQNRVNSMAIIHQKLYQQEDISKIDVKSYVTDLVDNLSTTYQLGSHIQIQKNIDDINIDVDHLIPIGLILNELISNAFKHGLGAPKPDIRISIKQVGDHLKIKVQDNGNGLPKDFSLDQLNSFGLKMVHSLTAKFQGNFECKSENGATFIVELIDWNEA